MYAKEFIFTTTITKHFNWCTASELTAGSSTYVMQIGNKRTLTKQEHTINIILSHWSIPYKDYV